MLFRRKGMAIGTFACMHLADDFIQNALHSRYSEVYFLLWSQAGESSQVETVSEENKGLIWTLLKQLRPGMDLSKVVLPTFILEPRSFLDKLSDYYYHADLLSQWAPHYQHYCSQTHFTGTSSSAFIGKR